MTKKRQSLAEFKRQQDSLEPQDKEKRSDKELAQQQSNIYGSLFVLGVLIVAALAVFFYLNRDEPLPELTTNLDLNTIPDNSQSFANQGNQHIASDAPREPYNSNP